MTWPGGSYAEFVKDKARCGASALPLLYTIETIVDISGRTHRAGIRASRPAHPDRTTKQFPPLRPRGQPRNYSTKQGTQCVASPQDDEMGRVPRVCGRRSWPGMASHPAEAGGFRGTGGGPWTGITSAGSVSGLELRRACFCLSPSAPWEYSPFLGVLHLEMARELATTRVVEALLTPVGQGWAEHMIVGAVHDRWHYFYTFVCRDSALLVAQKEQRGLGT